MAQGRAMSRQEKARLVQLHRDGFSIRQCAERLGVSYHTAYRHIRSALNSGGYQVREEEADAELGGPKSRGELAGAALEALDDFELFRRRYLGHVSLPWHVEAAERVTGWMEEPGESFVVVNVAPGSGKSTLFGLDIPLWLICRDRGVRQLLGSFTTRQARLLSRRVKTQLETSIPIPNRLRDVDAGVAVDPVAALAKDYGRFRPANREAWTQEQFTVAQIGDVMVAEKEPTVSAFSRQSEFLGWRVDLAIWDDLVSTKVRTAEAQEDLQAWWEEYAETRLEPNGVIILQGQRLRPDDLYRYCLDRDLDPPDDIIEIDATATKQYRHVVYPAHFEDRCTGHHDPKTVEAYPNGCLLDPHRLGWKKLEREARKGSFRTVYQQEDVNPAEVLVNPAWVQNCWDKNRDLWELPAGITGPYIGVCTADPSPTQYWAVQAWAYHPETESRILLDTYKGKLEAPDFLGFNPDTREFYGLMHDWTDRFNNIGIEGSGGSVKIPLVAWIVEVNAAQRFLLQQEIVKRWQRQHSIRIIGHTTGRNKSDADLGVETIGPQWEFGRVRLPGKQKTEARPHSMRLVDEVTRYPDGSTNDQVMAEWFLEHNLPTLWHPPRTQPAKRRTPSWMRTLARTA